MMKKYYWQLSLYENENKHIRGNYMTENKEKLKEEKPKEEKPKFESKIEDVDCVMKIRKKAFLIEYENTAYITSLELVEKLLKGELTKKDGGIAKAVHMGIFNADGIDNDTDVYMSIKDKSVFFSPEKGTLLIAPISSLEKLLHENWDNVKMGRFTN